MNDNWFNEMGPLETELDTGDSLLKPWCLG